VIFVDTLLLLSLDGSVGVAMPPGGPARGNTPIELFHVAGRLAPPPPPPGLDGGGSRGGGGRGGGWSGRGSGQYVSFSAGAPRCVFSDASVTTSGQWHGREGAASLWSVRCPSPSRLVAGGFEAVRVRVHGVGVADTSAQFLVHADARVRQVFPRLSWGPEVVHVTGEHLAGAGGHGGGAIDGSAMLGGMAPWGTAPACVYGGRAAPAHVVSSTYVACEV